MDGYARSPLNPFAPAIPSLPAADVQIRLVLPSQLDPRSQQLTSSCPLACFTLLAILSAPLPFFWYFASSLFSFLSLSLSLASCPQLFSCLSSLFPPSLTGSASSCPRSAAPSICARCTMSGSDPAHAASSFQFYQFNKRNSCHHSTRWLAAYALAMRCSTGEGICLRADTDEL